MYTAVSHVSFTNKVETNDTRTSKKFKVYYFIKENAKLYCVIQVHETILIPFSQIARKIAGSDRSEMGDINNNDDNYDNDKNNQY